MDWIINFIDIVRHLNVHLDQLVITMGPWFYVAMFAIIFCETGLVLLPFLPGDSLLFSLGAISMLTSSEINLPVMGMTLLIAAISGDALNYTLGYWTGPKVFKYEKSLLLNKDHLNKAQGFYEKYGKKTIILARFIPIIRTFAPFVAGIAKMKYSVFFAYNVIGAVAWVGLCMGAGVLFGQIPWVKSNFEFVILGIIIVSLLPMVFEFIAHRRAKNQENSKGRLNEKPTNSEVQSKAG